MDYKFLNAFLLSVHILFRELFSNIYLIESVHCAGHWGYKDKYILALLMFTVSATTATDQAVITQYT